MEYWFAGSNVVINRAVPISSKLTSNLSPATPAYVCHLQLTCICQQSKDTGSSSSGDGSFTFKLIGSTNYNQVRQFLQLLTANITSG